MMKKALGTAFAVAMTATALAQVAPADAAGTVTVSSPRCQVLRVSNTTSTTQVVTFDSRHEIEIGANKTLDYVEVTSGGKIPAGDYIWIRGTKSSSGVSYSSGAGRVKVAKCTSTAATRPVEGDQNGDGKADVLGIQASTGDLYYYRMTNTTLANGIKAGHGWNAMIYMQQVNEIDGQGTGNRLVAARNDGTIWMYNNHGKGSFSSGRQIGKGFGGYTNFTVTQLNSTGYFGAHMLLARKGGTVYAWSLSNTGLRGMGANGEPGILGTGFGTTTKLMSLRDFDGDNIVELVSIRTDGTMWRHDFNSRLGGLPLLAAPVRIGTGWNAMQTVSSPGSLNGDHNSDAIARRADGNLYKYINAGGRWYAGQKIGTNWQKIRLLA